MMYSQSKAEIALDTHIQTTITNIDLTFANIPYTPSVMEPYIKIIHRPGRKFQASLGDNGWNRISGIMFVYISYPVGASVGTYAANMTAERVVALFEIGTVLVHENVTVNTTSAQRVAAIEGDTRFTPVVEIKWYSYVSRDAII